MYRSIKAAVRRWSQSRRPRGAEVTLTQKQIFIFPTAAGWAYGLVCLVLLLVATNYQNNLISALAYLLIALGILTIHYTFFNLSGLKIKAIKGYHCYAGDMAEFQFQLSSERMRVYESIQCAWQDQPISRVDIEKGESKPLFLYAKTNHRGRFAPEDMKVETIFPLGLFRAWSWIKPELEILVYPKPQQGRRALSNTVAGDESEQPVGMQEGEDFHALEEYQEGMSPKRIAWKQFAQGRGLLSKQFTAQQDQQLWLDWEAWPELGYEARLSVICYWAQQCEYDEIHYGVRLPNIVIKPAQGAVHFDAVLKALAEAPVRSSGAAL